MTRRLRLLWTVCAGGVLGLAVEGAAHEFWIRPSSFTPAVGAPVDVRLLVGDREAEELSYDRSRIIRFESRSSGVTRPMRGVDGRRPAGRAAFRSPGWHTLVYESRHTFIELPAPRFEGYLEEEGLDEISELRFKQHRSDEPGRESFARYCKSLVRVGQGGGPYDGRVGLPIEMVLETDPAAWSKGQRIQFQLTFQGEPLEGRLVKLIRLADRDVRQLGTTGADGRVRFVPPGRGEWMVSAVHMTRTREGVEGDWESWWASSSFLLEDASAVAE